MQAARAGYDQAVANYRQAVLTAFGQVEDNLAAQRVLAEEQPELQAAVDRRRPGPAHRAQPVQGRHGRLHQRRGRRGRRTTTAHNAELPWKPTASTTTVDLIVALGGGWNADELNDKGTPSTGVFP